MADESCRNGCDQHLREESAVIKVLDDLLEDKVIADNGVLNAAANPAAAPDNSAGRRPCLAMPSHPAMFDASAPAIWTVGPSRPRLQPPPIEIAPAKNFAITTLAGINPKSLQNAIFTWGIPLPAASRLMKARIRPAMIDAVRIVAKLKSAKVPAGIRWDVSSKKNEKMMLAPF